MKLRYLLFIFFILFSYSAGSQPTETTYLASIARAGYADDASYGPFNIGFSFTYYGIAYTQFHVSSNGLVLFTDDPANISGYEVSIPNSSKPDNFIAAFWDDLVIDGTGKILYTTIGAAPNRKLIIQCKNMGFVGFPAFMGTFSIILYETSNKIQVQYRLISG